MVWKALSCGFMELRGITFEAMRAKFKMLINMFINVCEFSA